MKYVVIFFLFCYAPAAAQLTPEQRIQDSVIGWWSNNKFDHLKTPADAAGKKKEAHVNKMVEWMKQSYTPVGGLGTTSRYIDKTGYGVLCYVWNVSHDKQWTEPNGKFRPIPEENTAFWIAANRVFGSFTIPFLKKENEYYFTMQPDGYGATDQSLRKKEKADPRIHPNAYHHITWANDWQTVYLAPGNKLPFTAITKGELLQRAAASMEKQLADELKDVQAKWPGNKKAQDDAMLYRTQTVNKYRSNIQTLLQRHQNSLNEPAVIRAMQPNMYSFELDPDIFSIDNYSKQLKHAYQVYKIDAALYTKLQSDVPQWIAVAWPYQRKEDGNQLYELHTALSRHINYDYIYNYFFDPEKVKGIPYKPANEAELVARLNAYRKKNAASLQPVADNTNQPAGTFFFDDFASSNPGGDPANWYFNKYGKHHTVSAVTGQPGKWLQLGYGTETFPSLLKKPIPENFKLEFDVVTDGGFTSRTGGAIRVTLNTRPANQQGMEITHGNGSTITMELMAGNEADYNNNNYRGLLRINLKTSPAVHQQNGLEGLGYEYDLREFTNKKTKIQVALRVKAGAVTVFINNKEVAASGNFKLAYGAACSGNCGLPAGSRFNSIFFKNTTNDVDITKVYISNITITKE